MQITVNGFARQARDGLPLLELLAAEGDPAELVLVEVNGEYLPRPQLAGRVLAEGDRIELILPAFGG